MTQIIEMESYVVTQDSQALFERINGRPISDGFVVACNTYFTALQQVLAEGVAATVELIGYTENDISQRLAKATREKLMEDPQAYCLCLDRYLLADVQREFPDRFFRFSLTRTTDGRKVPRVGDPPFTKQIQALITANPDIGDRPGILVDDGIFSGGTMQDTRALFDQAGVPLRIQTFIGFIGSPVVQKNGTRILEPTNKLYEWIDIRDFSPLGGKTAKISRNNRVAASVPYLYPWSYGESASLDRSPRLFDISRGLIENFRALVQAFEQVEYARPLTFRDLVNAGFALPTSAHAPLPISINDRVTDYLDRCLSALDTEQERQVTIFDMDGTLYLLDGTNNGFAGSTLEKTVRENALAFIMERESCSYQNACTVYDTGAANPIGLSQYLSERYGISREAYFAQVWDIDPTPIIRAYESAVATMHALKESTNTKLILLTSAPSAWATRVLSALGLTDAFELVFTGEQFGTKDEIFALLTQWYRPENILSVGDQEKTDILPARTRGCKTLLVATPLDVSKIGITA